jgi:hypothetical protein
VLQQLTPRVLGRPLGAFTSPTGVLDLVKQLDNFQAGCLAGSACAQSVVNDYQSNIARDINNLGWDTDPNAVAVMAFTAADDPSTVMPAWTALRARANAVANGQPDPASASTISLPPPVQNAPLIISPPRLDKTTSPVVSAVTSNLATQAATASQVAVAPVLIDPLKSPVPTPSATATASNATVNATPGVTMPTPTAPGPVTQKKGTAWGLLLGTGVVLAAGAWMMARR